MSGLKLRVSARLAQGITAFVEALLLLVCLMLAPAYSHAVTALDLSADHTTALGQNARYLQEQGDVLNYRQASQQMSQRGLPVDGEILSLGIGAAPVWMQLVFDNSAATPVVRYLSVENAWLDRIEVYFFHRGRLVNSTEAGDLLPFSTRSENNRYFLFKHRFAPGQTRVLLRIESADPLVVPLRIYSSPQSAVEASGSAYVYGALYGYLLALIAFNLLLALSLRSSRYLFYSIYLFSFLLLNAAYTGHAYQWLWPDLPQWQHCSNPLLMLLFVITGIMFANRFLEMRKRSRWLYDQLHRFMLGLISLAALFFVLQKPVYMLYLAFLSIAPFVVIMTFSGALALKQGMKEARYFLVATLFASVGAGVTALTVAGAIPYQSLAFHAVELGMVVEATMFALALAYQFRVQQEQRIRAEHMAEVDQLTGAYNRRGFERMMVPVFSTAQRNQRSLSLLILDLDHFKNVNDYFGHAAGDEVLKQIAHVLRTEIRQGDLLARWGGEEFVILLPETALGDAVTFAQRLRERCAGRVVQHEQDQIQCTVSIGIAALGGDTESFEELLQEADSYLYEAKAAGRNRVCYELPRMQSVIRFGTR